MESELHLYIHDEKTDCYYKTIRFHSPLKSGENVTKSPRDVKVQ